MRFWAGVAGAFGVGIVLGTGLGTLLVEKKLKEEYAESTAAMRRAYEALKIDAETPALTEDDLIHIKHHEDGTIMLEGGAVTSISLDKEPNAFGETINIKKIPEEVTDVVVQPTQSDNPYHTAVAQTTTGVYASYSVLSDEDYQDEDGRLKEQITMLFSDGEPIFFKDGAELEVSDAMDMVGSTIVDDMRAAVREGNPILFMRNNQTEVDYEVVFEQP